MKSSVNDLFSFNFTTYHKILKVGGKKGPEVLALYIRYIEQSKLQNKDETFSLDKFMIKNMKWSKNKFYEVKKILIDLGLIEQIKRQGGEAKVKVNFIIGEKKSSDISKIKTSESSEVLKTETSEEKAIESKNSEVLKTEISQKPGVVIFETQNNKEYNIKIKNINNNSKELLEQAQDFFSDFSDYKKIEDPKKQKKEEKTKQESEKGSARSFFYLFSLSVLKVLVPVSYGNEDINKTLEFLKKVVGCDDFRESRKWQRIWAKHIFELGKKIGNKDFLFRLQFILKDGFKAKNCNSLEYIYKEVKSFIHSPIVPVEQKNQKKPVTFSG